MGHIKIAQNFNCMEAIFCPVNLNLISVCGKDNFKLLRHQDDDVKIALNNIMFKEKK